MKKILFLVFLILAFAEVKADEIDIIKFSDLKEIIEDKNNNLLVVNFWATWCAPCVKELHQFDELKEKYKGQNVKVVLVSFDFADQLNKRVIPFVEKRKVKSKVVLLDETDYNSFIDQIDPSWSGAIPATLMIDRRNGLRKEFYEKEFREGQLDQTFSKFIN
jgi:thiol-disulfide isomerase/thioredoxin